MTRREIVPVCIKVELHCAANIQPDGPFSFPSSRALPAQNKGVYVKDYIRV